MTGPLADCVDTDHFDVAADGLRPQPWMRHRLVASTTAPSVAKSYAAAAAGAGFIPGIDILDAILGGAANPVFGASIAGNKNDLIHSIRVRWLNDTPITQWCYGLVTRGGCRVTLQARSRAYLALSTGSGTDPSPELTLASAMGCGADTGRAGALAVGTGFCVFEQRQNTVTIPLSPERTGWTLLNPGDTFTGIAELRFVSDVWESSTIDGGDVETESGFLSGETRIDLFAVPLLEPTVITEPPPPPPPVVGIDGGTSASTVTAPPDTLDGGTPGAAGAGTEDGGVP